MYFLEIIIHTCGYYILVLLIAFEILFSICKLNWILNSFSFLQYLATTLHTNIFNFYSTILPWNH